MKQNDYNDGGIGWCKHTFIPWEGCEKVSPGCKNCYAEKRIVGRFKLQVWGSPQTTPRHRTSDLNWRKMVSLNSRLASDGIKETVFTNSHGDIFEEHPMLEPWRTELFAMMEQCKNLIWLVLTKRPQNITKMVPTHWLNQWPHNVVCGTSVENREVYIPRAMELMKVPCHTRFLSLGPLLEYVPLGLAGIVPYDVRSNYTPVYQLIHWVIIEGESGDASGKYTARPCHVDWIENIVKECLDFEVPVYVKQLGDNAYYSRHPIAKSYHGKDIDTWPEHIRIQQFPDFENRLR